MTFERAVHIAAQEYPRARLSEERLRKVRSQKPQNPPNLSLYREHHPAGDVLATVLRFYFNLYDDLVSIDEEGKELPSLQAARERAMADARHMAGAEALEGHLNLKHRIEIADENGKVLAIVRFEDAVEIES